MESPYYLEAEINSPLVQLRPGETRDLDTEWFPTRAGSEFHGVEDAGIVVHPLQATRLDTGHVRLSGSFGVFFAGRLVAHLYDEHGADLGTMPLTQVDPSRTRRTETELRRSRKALPRSRFIWKMRTGSTAALFKKLKSRTFQLSGSKPTDMKSFRKEFTAAALAAFSVVLFRRSTTSGNATGAGSRGCRRECESRHDLLTQPPGANWTSYNGDYTGRRYSALHEITRSQCRATPRSRGSSILPIPRGWK